MGLRWWRDVLNVAGPSATLTTARRVNTGSHRFVRLSYGTPNLLKIRGNVSRLQIQFRAPFGA